MMMNALQALGPWRIAVAVAIVAIVVLLPVWRARRRHRRAVLREVQRLRRELAMRDAMESQQ
jgi:C4-dicarboxylate-specific signal transduction histidine kinase